MGAEVMTKKEVKVVLSCPSKPLLMLALELVNLTIKEINSIRAVDIDGLTNEEASETLNYSITSIKKYRKNAYDKMSKAWKNEELIAKILEWE